MSAGWVLAREAPLTRGWVRRAGTLGNEISFSASLHVGCCGAGCDFRPELGSVSLGDSETCCLGAQSPRPLAGKPRPQQV